MLHQKSSFLQYTIPKNRKTLTENVFLHKLGNHLIKKSGDIKISSRLFAANEFGHGRKMKLILIRDAQLLAPNPTDN